MSGADNYVLRRMIEDLQGIQRECDPQAVQAAQGEGKEKMDQFEAAKRDLTFMLVELKKSVERRNEMMQNYGRQEQTIRLKAENEKILHEAKVKFNEAKKAYDAQAGKKKGKRLPDQVLSDRKDMLDMLEADIKDIEAMHTQARPKRGSNRDIAGKLQATRKKEREEDEKQGRAPVEMKEMGEVAHQFIMEKQEHDAKMDTQLDQILTGVEELKNVAIDMNDELNVQAVVAQEIVKKMDELDSKFKTANQRMNTLLEETGGATRWCTLMIAFVILIALLAYIFNIIVL